MDALSSALSGLRSAELRFAASAHNVANTTTRDFHALRVQQHSQTHGGSAATLVRSPNPGQVDLAREFVEQTRAALQFNASLRVFKGYSETRGHLLDVLA